MEPWLQSATGYIRDWLEFQLRASEQPGCIVAIAHRGKLVAVHQRSQRPHRPSTIAEHMPSSHRRYRDWTHERIQREAAAIGGDTATLVQIVLRSRPHPEQGFRTCLGILRSYRGIDAARVEAVSGRALELGVLNCKGVAAVVLTGFCGPGSSGTLALSMRTSAGSMSRISSACSGLVR